MHINHCLLLVLCAGVTVAGAPAAPRFTAVDVDTKVEIGYGIAVADVNGDKKPDILLVDKAIVAWYENPSWTKHVMAGKLTQQDHVCLAAQDIDGDGRCEVAVGAGWNPSDTLNSGAVFYLIPPADRTQPWEAVTLPREPTVHRMRWVRNTRGAFDLVMVPLHGRGNKPATGEGAGVKVLAYRPPSNPRDPWSTEVLDESMHKTHNFDPLQWDADPAQEMLVGGKEGVFLLDRAPGKSSMTQLSGTENGGVGEVRAGKLSGGKRFFATIEPMHGNNLVIYHDPGSAKGLWVRQMLDTTLADGHALACGDLTGTGGDQVVVGWRAMNRPGVKVGIKLFTPADASAQKWESTVVDDNTMACEDLVLADLDANGKLDIVAAGRATRNVKIYLNQ